MKPTHYADPQGDLIDIIYQACPMAAIFFCAVNSIKYHKRLGKKDGASVLDDLDKAQEYHRRLEAMLDGKPISYYMRLANQAYFQDKSDEELDQMCAEMAQMPDDEFDANMAALADTLKETTELPEGVTVDTRPCPEFDTTKYRRLNLGEVIPPSAQVLAWGRGPWVEVTDPFKHMKWNFEHEYGFFPHIVPIDHPITPFKNEA